MYSDSTKFNERLRITLSIPSFVIGKKHLMMRWRARCVYSAKLEIQIFQQKGSSRDF